MQARADWWTDTAAGIGGIAPDRLVFSDESAVLTSMARRYGRSPRGERAFAKVPFGNWKRLIPTREKNHSSKLASDAR